MIARRHSIGGPVSLQGIGLHLGRECTLTFHPAPSGEGIVFRRIDLPGAPTVLARADLAVLTERHTQLGSGEAAVHTVEHVLAAVAGLEIDDIRIDLDAAEPPILDGSARPFHDALSSVGITDVAGEVEYLMLRSPLTLRDGKSTYTVHPSATLSIEVTIDFPHPLIGRQSCQLPVTPSTFAADLAGARTFGFLREADALRAMGLIQGVSTANTVVLDDDGPVETELRWDDEFVRHKTMDFIGDLALAGKRVRGRIVADRPSHRGTVTLVREMLKRAAEETRMTGADDIIKALPHRYPFLLVDRVLEHDPGKRIVGLKNVTINEPFFQGHFPGHPIMPGVLIVESMAQVGGLLLLGQVPDPSQTVVYFTSLDNVKFRRPVKPGDQLRIEVDMVQLRGRMCKIHGIARVDGEIVCEADMGAMVRDR
ncbi:MAG: UDP-3-O-[3-hydroxymyristoyl] N-acetylglucosamine deacetylase [Gemmatimonadaceae bacterium]|nr:UDP-3-O-[3-hydroxymyristoyl] N-acetylglucosamine deacetylase [Gemmatimonadaceae bacterium]